eukprot:TRINITY_DN2907_c0_g1_i3.p1 TRINITY_DN2907_c0_g1~~TRINITY_DN2907_c0_g1_i3.p1  ORF type:complete len:799 (+),score=199.47 TRINITY_DN2907_c0_g1_i3:221-2617(+)
MNQKQSMQYKALAANGPSSIRRRSEKDINARCDKIGCSLRSGSGVSINLANYHFNAENISPADNVGLSLEDSFGRNKGRSEERISNNRLLFLTMLLIGQPVEVHVKNGSIYSGIFHTANIDKDYGIVLKMARLIKDGVQGDRKDNYKDNLQKAHIKTFMILAKDLVQVVAKDIPLTEDATRIGRIRENCHEILTDAALAHGHQLEGQRELKPWTPDKDIPEDLDLENTFQNTRNRYWDQFETNKSLFGIESTFDEELYTTKLEKGPQTKELELKASQIAREIEEEACGNFHLAEERGICFGNGPDQYDEESRFSSVIRVEDIGEDNEDTCIDDYNEQTFGSDSTCQTHTLPESEIENKFTEPTNSSVVEAPSYKQLPEENIISKSDSNKQSTIPNVNVNGLSYNSEDVKKDLSNLNLYENVKDGSSEKHSSSHVDGAETFGVYAEGDSQSSHIKTAVSHQPASDMVSSSAETSSQEEIMMVDKTLVPNVLPQSPSASSTAKSPAECEQTLSSSKKSLLNPNAKEFKLNPNAKCYTPCSGLVRSGPSAVQGPVYVASSISPGTPLQNLPGGLGLAPVVQQNSQAAKVLPYNNMINAAGVTAPSLVQPVATFLPRGTPIQPLLPVQSAVKISHPGNQIIGNSFVTQTPVRHASHASALNQAPGYLHPSNQLMMPGQVVYVQHFPNEIVQSSHAGATQGSTTTLLSSHPSQQPKHRASTVHGMQYIVNAPFASGQQPSPQSAPQQSNAFQASRGVLVPAPLSAIQIPQSVVLGSMGPNAGSSNSNNGIWGGGKASSAGFQQ